MKVTNSLASGTSLLESLPDDILQQQILGKFFKNNDNDSLNTLRALRLTSKTLMLAVDAQDLRVYLPKLATIYNITTGYNHTYMSSDDGRVYALGSNEKGRLGVIPDAPLPQQRNAPSGLIPYIIHALTHSLSLLTNNKSLDNNKSSATRDGEINQRTLSYTLTFPKRIKQLVAGNEHTFALLEDNELFTWGCNFFGQLGLGDRKKRKQATRLELPGPVKKIIAGYEQSFCILDNGDTYGWGSNQYYELGLGHDNRVLTPTKLNLPGPVKKIIPGQAHTFAVLENDEIYTWGLNLFGNLGLGDSRSRAQPVKLQLPELVKKIVAGRDCSFAVMESGSAYAWGTDNCGILGLARGRSDTPLRISLPDKVKTIKTREYAAFAILESGEVYAWGSNHSGQLGFEGSSATARPTRVPLPGKTKKLFLTSDSAFAVLETGEIYVWGQNKYGEIGAKDRKRPRQPERFDYDDLIRPLTKKARGELKDTDFEHAVPPAMLYQAQLGFADKRRLFEIPREKEQPTTKMNISMNNAPN